MRIRKNVKNLSSAEKTAYVQAVLALKNKPSTLHPGSSSRYDDYAEVHMNAMMAEEGSVGQPGFIPGWAHNAPAFFPWHREMLLQFENDLVAINPSIALPYWDWTDPASSPFTSDFLGGDGTGSNHKVTDGPFANWTITVKDQSGDPSFLQRQFGVDVAGHTAHVLPTATQVADTINNYASYDNAPWKGNTSSFRSQVEYALHNWVHRWVGGTMLNMTSPNDPVFFLHHCNIDRLWALWQHKHPSAAPYLPSAGAQQGHNATDTLIFHASSSTAPWSGTATPISVVDHLALGYTYDTDAVVPAGVREHSMAWVRILVGVINDSPGIVIGPDGKPHRVPGGPGDPPWARLSHAQRDDLMGHVLAEISRLVSHQDAQQSLKQLSAQLRQKR